jgi:hypothetical protein
MRNRTYGESLLKSFTGRTNTPISNSDFTSNELANLDNLIKQHHQQKVTYFTRPKTKLLQEAAQLKENAQYDLENARKYLEHPAPDELRFSFSDRTIMAKRAQDRAKLSLTQAQQLRSSARKTSL